MMSIECSSVEMSLQMLLDSVNRRQVVSQTWWWVVPEPRYRTGEGRVTNDEVVNGMRRQFVLSLELCWNHIICMSSC